MNVSYVHTVETQILYTHTELELTAGSCFLRDWLSKSNLLGYIYYTFAMERSVMIYKMLLLLLNG